MENDEYFFEYSQQYSKKRMLILVIYDIIDNNKRTKFMKLLLGYGNRVQKSAFEAYLTKQQYNKLIKEIPKFCSEEDSIRVYRIVGEGHVLSWGKALETEDDDVILI